MSTYTPIASVTLSSAQSSVTFSGIPQTYTDLVVVGSIKTGANTYQPILRFNGDSGSNYSSTVIAGSGSAASSNRHTNQNGIYANPGPGIGTAGDFWPWIVQVQNYTNTNINKTVLHRFNNAQSYVVAGVGLWRNTAAITSITLVAEAGSNDFQSGSTFNLYGVANASITNVAKATGGDSVTTDGTYWYHTFRTSGTFTPTQALTADCLVVAGGGGGASGGGGAGGLLAYTSQSLTAQNYTVTVGAGGGGSANGANTTAGTSGSNSQFGSLTASVGGGGAGGALTNNAATGGSGGGGGAHDGAQTTGANGTSGQGNAGGGNGNFRGNPNIPAGGGGGAGGAGGSATSNTARGVGGAGSTSYSSWATATGTGVSSGYAGGGGGGAYVAGGTGGTATHGGGTGNSGSTNGVAGTANTGGGGGGSGQSGAAGAGGSGIVIVRYAV